MSARLRLVLLLVVLPLAGCLNALDRARMATTAAADLGLSVGKFAAELNENREAEIANIAAVDHDAPKAKAERDRWRGTYAKIEQAVKVYAAAVSVTRGVVEVAASTGKLNISKILAELAQAARSLKGALAAFGVEMPGGGLL